MARTNKQNTAAAAPTEQQETQQTTEQQTQDTATEQTGEQQQQDTGAATESSGETQDTAEKVAEAAAGEENKEATEQQSSDAGAEKTLDIQLDPQDKDPEGTVAAITEAAQQMATGATLEVKTTEAVEGQNAVVTEEQPVEQVDPLVAQMRNVGVNFRQKMALNKSYSASDAVSCATQLCVAIDALLREQNLERFSAAWVALVEEIKTGRKTVFAETAIYRGWRERNFMHNSPEKARKYQHIIALLASSADIGVAETKGVFDVRGLCNRLGLSETASRNLLALYSV